MRSELRFTCPLRNGLHARPASVLAEVAKRFRAAGRMKKEGGAAVDIRSVLSLVGLDVQFGDTCVLELEGDDAAEAAAALKELIEGAWIETDDVPVSPLLSSGAEEAQQKCELPIGLRGLEVAFAWGTPVCAGIGIGRAVMTAGLALPAELAGLKAASMERELEGAERALSEVSRDLRRRAGAARKKFEVDLLGAHAGIAEDPALHEEIARRVRAGATGAQAVVAAATKFCGALGAASSAYVRDRCVDVQDVGMQVLERLTGGKAGVTQINLESDSVVVADVLTANQLMRLDHKRLRGLVLGSVGATSHTVILARSLQVPTILNARGALTLVAPGEEVVADADTGLVIKGGTPAVQRHYAARVRTLQRRRARLKPLAQGEARTRDGVRLEIGANASTPAEVVGAVEHGAEGVGLLRTEVLFLDRETAPSEAEQYEAYAAVVEAAAGRAVIIRTLDIGGDKPAPYLALPREENPFLGERGLRLYAGHAELVRAQLRAIVRASARGRVKLMAPMVSTPGEAAWFRVQVRAVQAELRSEGVKFDEGMPIGVMVEVASLALVMDQLSRHVDFCSLGTNDLCQYWMAADRGNARVARLSNPMEPSFLRLLRTIVDAAHTNGKWIGVCGDMAGRPGNLAAMVGLGVDEISVPPGEILQLKTAVAGLDAHECREALEEACASDSAAEAERIVRGASARVHGDAAVLDAQAIVMGSEAATKEEAIREAVDALYVAGRTDRPGEVEEAVWARERTYSTGLGYGFAVPHCKSEAVGAPSLAVVRLRSGVEWGAMDGQAVSVVILLAVPSADTTGAHMKVFAKLARRLMHEGFRERLMGADSGEAVDRVLREELELDGATVEIRREISK